MDEILHESQAVKDVDRVETNDHGASRVFARRKFLKWSLLIGGGTLAGVALIKSRPIKFAAYGKLQVLSPYEADIAHAFAEAILPHGDNWPSIEETGLIQRMDEELYFLDPKNSSDFKAVLMLLEFFPFTFGKLGRFTRLS